jgi:hypothetical protein
MQGSLIGWFLISIHIRKLIFKSYRRVLPDGREALRVITADFNHLVFALIFRPKEPWKLVRFDYYFINSSNISFCYVVMSLINWGWT